MLRRWCIPLVTTALVTGTWLAAGSASAAPLAAHPVAAPPATQGFSPGGPMVRPVTAGRSGAAPGALNAEVESLNWSGYAATGANGTFTSVSASWTQPAATCPSSSAQYSSFWAGLDGFSSDSVEQTGADSDCDGTTPAYYGWYEMFPAAPVTYTNRVEPGDHMSASVTFSGTRTYTLVLTDSTQGWTRTVTKKEAGLDRSSAEVITEAPSFDDRRAAARGLRHRQLRQRPGERDLARRPEPDRDRDRRRQRQPGGLHQRDQQRRGLQQHLARQQLGECPGPEYRAAKVACEAAVLGAPGDRADIAGVGLIRGLGDRSDRSGYRPARFRRAGDGPVLVPAISGQPGSAHCPCGCPSGWPG